MYLSFSLAVVFRVFALVLIYGHCPLSFGVNTSLDSRQLLFFDRVEIFRAL